MSVTAWKYPQVGVDYPTDLDPPHYWWTNPSYICADDNNYATASANGKGGSPNTGYLVGYRFGFTESDLPVGCTITGIELAIGRYTDNTLGFQSDNALYLGKGGTTFENFVRNSDNMASAEYWPVVEGEKLYGGDGNMWGSSGVNRNYIMNTNINEELAIILSSDTTNSSAEGSSPFYVDYFKIRFHYESGSERRIFISKGL